MKSFWKMPICSGKERLRNKKNLRAHPTQKPEALLYRIILSTTRSGDIVLDPFLGSGTTAVVSKKLGRNFIGIEKNREYYDLAKLRLKKTIKLDSDTIKISKSRKELPKIPFGELVEQGIIPPGSILSDSKNRFKAKVKIDGSISIKDIQGSIHQVGAKIQGLPSCNGWDYWHFNENDSLKTIDILRNQYRTKKV